MLTLMVSLICVGSTKDGCKTYMKWKRTWSSNAKVEANVKLFLVDRYLPFWLQCMSCGRWRQLPNDAQLTPELVRSYKCDAGLEVTAFLMLPYIIEYVLCLFKAFVFSSIE